MKELLAQQNKLSLSLTLPSSEVQVFDRGPANYYNFDSHQGKNQWQQDAPTYLGQYTHGDVHD